MYARETKLATTVYICLLAILFTAVGLQYLFSKDVYWISVTQWVVPSQHPVMESVVDVLVPIVGVSVATAASVLTVLFLVYTRSRARTRGSVTVILMNLGLMVWLLMLLCTTHVTPIGYYSMPQVGWY